MCLLLTYSVSRHWTYALAEVGVRKGGGGGGVARKAERGVSGGDIALFITTVFMRI